MYEPRGTEVGPFHHGSSEEVFFLFFAGGACGSDFRFVISVWKEFACNINSSKTCQLCCVGSHLTLFSCSKWSNFSLVRSSASWFDSRGIQSSVKLHRDNLKDSESSMMKTVKGKFRAHPSRYGIGVGLVVRIAPYPAGCVRGLTCMRHP